MTGLVAAVLVAISAWNPAIVAERSDGIDRRRIGGTIVGVVVVLTIAAFTGPILDTIDVSPPTLRTGAGAVVGLTGARWLVGPRPRRDEGDGMALGFMDVITPAVVLAAMTTMASDGWSITTIALVVAATVSTAVAWAAPSGTVSAWLRRLAGGGAVAVGIALIQAGIRSV